MKNQRNSEAGKARGNEKARGVGRVEEADNLLPLTDDAIRSIFHTLEYDPQLIVAFALTCRRLYRVAISTQRIAHQMTLFKDHQVAVRLHLTEFEAQQELQRQDRLDYSDDFGIPVRAPSDEDIGEAEYYDKLFKGYYDIREDDGGSSDDGYGDDGSEGCVIS